MTTLKVCGQFQGTLKHGLHKAHQDIFVIQHLHKPLVGLPAIRALHLVSRVNAVSDLTEQVYERYPQLFSGLGSMTGEHTIRLNADATPFTISTPRRIALPLMPKVKSELERMEKLGVIKRVNIPTKWCQEWDGSSIEVRQKAPHLCRPYKVESKCPEGTPSHPIS